MSYDVQIIADSVGPGGARITTFQLKYPRMIHSEFMTHRAISRNTSSTRAIPTAKMVDWIRRDPAMPVYWGKNQKGMQATEELSREAADKAREEWFLAMEYAIGSAQYLIDCGVHKQIAGRILEPWAHINVVATATSWDNFFSLRCHKDAMPEIQALAVKMARAYRDSEPKQLEAYEWHLPYVAKEERQGFSLLDLIKLSVARCARVSFMTFDGKPSDPTKDFALHDQLEANGHWSPFEHQACARPGRSGNFLDWTQYRQTLRKSVHERFDFAKLDEFGDRDFIV